MVAIIERNRDFKFLTNKELLEQAKINSKTGNYFVEST